MSDQQKKAETFGLIDDGAYLKAVGPTGTAYITKGKPSLWVDHNGKLWKKLQGATVYHCPKEYEGVRVPEMKGMTIGENRVGAVVANFGVGTESMPPPPGGEAIYGSSDVVSNVMAGTDGPAIPAESYGSRADPYPPMPASRPPFSTDSVIIAGLIVAVAIFAAKYLPKRGG